MLGTGTGCFRFGQLISLRRAGRRSDPSGAQLYAWALLRSMRLISDPEPASGFPQTRGSTGAVIRWGGGWFEEVRNHMGWKIEKHDKPGIQKRIDTLLQLFGRSRLDSLCDSIFEQMNLSNA